MIGASTGVIVWLGVFLLNAFKVFCKIIIVYLHVMLQKPCGMIRHIIFDIVAIIVNKINMHVNSYLFFYTFINENVAFSNRFIFFNMCILLKVTN